MFRIKIFTRNKRKFMYIREINYGLILLNPENMQLKDAESSMTIDGVIEILKKETSIEYNKILKLLKSVKEHDYRQIEKKNYFVYSLAMHPSRECNLACTYCFANEPENCLPQKGISIDMAQKAIDFMVNNYGRNGVKYQIDIAGSGEPLLKYSFIKELHQYCQKTSTKIGKEIKIMFPTNATLLNEEMINYFQENRDILIGISLDGNMNHSINRILKNGKNAFNVIHDGAKKLKRPFGISVTITHANEDVDCVYEYLYSEFEYADSISMQLVRNFDINSEISFWNINKENLIVHYQKLADNLYSHALIEDYEYAYKIMRGADTFGKYLFRVLHAGQIRVERCGAGRGTICVDDNGDLYSCSVANGNPIFKIGNIEKGIDEDKKIKFEKANIYSSQKCARCWASYVCGGECLVKAFMTSGDFYEPNEQQCEVKKALIQICIELCERIKEKNIEVYKQLKNFSVDSKKNDSSLWAISKFLTSQNIDIEYCELEKHACRGKYGMHPDDMLNMLKSYIKGMQIFHVNQQDDYAKINYPAIAFVDKFKYGYQYMVIDKYEKNELICYSIAEKEAGIVRASEFLNTVSSTIFSTTNKYELGE